MNSGKADGRIGVGDRVIRMALKPKLFADQVHDDAVLFEELGLCRGLVRADIAVVNGALHGYEIKSDLDNVHRLQKQVEVYNKVLDYATLVVGERLLEEAVKAVPEWWGVLLVCSAAGRLEFETVRDAKQNSNRQPRALVELLWLEEATALLAKLGALRGVRGKPRRILWDRISDRIRLEEIATAVRAALKSRARAQAAPLPLQHDESCRVVAKLPQSRNLGHRPQRL